MNKKHSLRHVKPYFFLFFIALAGCGSLTDGQRLAGTGLAVGAIVGGNIPTTDIQQVYYLGMFDPQEQLPPTIYRIRVRGQSGMINSTKFSSGWVHADLIDSLSTLAHAGKGGGFGNQQLAPGAKSFDAGRRLVMFGPEGFREAPKDHRLVVVMGADPQKFFSAVDQALGTIAAATQGTSGVDLQRSLFFDITELDSQAERFDSLGKEARMP